jgi:hypothetical protein
LGPAAKAGVNYYAGASGPGSFGDDSIGFLATSGSGDHFGIFGFYQAIFIPWGYNSGSSISAKSTLANQIIASLQLIPGKNVWTWGMGPTADSLPFRSGKRQPPFRNQQHSGYLLGRE